MSIERSTEDLCPVDEERCAPDQRTVQRRNLLSDLLLIVVVIASGLVSLYHPRQPQCSIHDEPTNMDQLASIGELLNSFPCGVLFVFFFWQHKLTTKAPTGLTEQFSEPQTQNTKLEEQHAASTDLKVKELQTQNTKLKEQVKELQTRNTKLEEQLATSTDLKVKELSIDGSELRAKSVLKEAAVAEWTCAPTTTTISAPCSPSSMAAKRRHDPYRTTTTTTTTTGAAELCCPSAAEGRDTVAAGMAAPLLPGSERLSVFGGATAAATEQPKLHKKDSCQVFVGQLPNEQTAAVLIYVIQLLFPDWTVGKQFRVQPQTDRQKRNLSTGCAWVWTETEMMRDTLLDVHQQVKITTTYYGAEDLPHLTVTADLCNKHPHLWNRGLEVVYVPWTSLQEAGGGGFVPGHPYSVPSRPMTVERSHPKQRPGNSFVSS